MDSPSNAFQNQPRTITIVAGKARKTPERERERASGDGRMMQTSRNCDPPFFFFFFFFFQSMQGKSTTVIIRKPIDCSFTCARRHRLVRPARLRSATIAFPGHPRLALSEPGLSIHISPGRSDHIIRPTAIHILEKKT